MSAARLCAECGADISHRAGNARYCETHGSNVEGQRRWRARHTDEAAAYQREWTADHPGRRSAYARNYYAKHRDELRAYQRAYYRRKAAEKRAAAPPAAD